jgi:DNA-directed RNA polymerase specialized sigma24 family protein
MECRSWTRTAHSAVNLDEIPDASSNRGAEFIAVDNALQRLAEFDPRKAQVVELLRGLSVEESAEVLKISPQSVMRDWKLAKAWRKRELSS